MNSKKKGSRGERQCRDVWKKHGYEEAHRSQQYSGRGESSADIEGIDPRLHIEVKSGYSFKTIYTFLEQAISDAKEGQTPIVNCKMDRKEWLCVMRLDDFIDMWSEKMTNAICYYFHCGDGCIRCQDCKYCIEYVPLDSFEKRYKCEKIFSRVLPDGHCRYAEGREDE